MLIAVISLIFSMLACHFEGWFKLAYITTEISFSINTTIVILFWGLLWPLMTSLGMLEDSTVRMYQALVHILPMVTTVTELAFTDMALEKRHWWIMVLVMCPFYMLANLWGSFYIPKLYESNKDGGVYGLEGWRVSPVRAIFVFMIMAFAQGGTFYCLCSIIERVWPKKAEEHYELETEGNSQSLIN